MALGLRQIRYFIAIADAGVLSRAAETLNIAQSALSHHVAALETDLGVKLLERRPRGIALTAAGRRLYEHASAVLSALGKAEEDVRTYNEAATGPVCIGLSHTALSMVALDVMKAVRKHSPGVHLTVVEALSPALVERVFSGTVDLALAYNPPRDARLDVALLHDEDLYLVGHPSLIGRSSGPIAFSAVPQRSVVGLTPMPASRAIIQTQVLRNQITPSETLEVEFTLGIANGARGWIGMRDPLPRHRPRRPGGGEVSRAAHRRSAADAFVRSGCAGGPAADQGIPRGSQNRGRDRPRCRRRRALARERKRPAAQAHRPLIRGHRVSSRKRPTGSRARCGRALRACRDVARRAASARSSRRS